MNSLLMAVAGVEQIRRVPVLRLNWRRLDVDALRRKSARMARHNRRERAAIELGIMDRFFGMEECE